MTIPSFGEKKQDVAYVNRYGVYAVIPNKDQGSDHPRSSS